MVLISEIFPNPKGKDTEGEWVELYNSGDALIFLSGWKLKDAAGKIFSFSSHKIPADGFLVLPYSETKIALNNDKETLFLYDAKGELRDIFSSSEIAGEDISFARALPEKEVRMALSPTPGKENLVALSAIPSAGADIHKSDPLLKGTGFPVVAALLVSLGLTFFCLWVFHRFFKKGKLYGLQKPF